MKKNMLFAAFAACGALFMSSCQEEMNPVASQPDADGLVTITAAFPEVVDSKVNFTEQTDGTGLDLTWEEDDYLTVISGQISQRYDIVTIDGKTATFKGHLVEGETFDIVLSRSGDYATRSYEGQIQATVSSTDHLLYDAVLKGVDTYSDVAFTSDWATENGGTLEENGCLMLNFKMPEDAGLLKSVTLTAPSDVFYTTNAADGAKTASLTLSLSDADMAADNVVKAYIMTSMQEASVAAETDLTLTVVSNLGTWSKKFTPNAFTLAAGKRNVITLNDTGWTVPAGDGSEANPYILRTADDLTGMADKLATEKKYFAMVNDIDMVSVTEWIEISDKTPINFNGNDKAISNFKPESFPSYPGFISILNGEVKDLNIISALISGGTSSSGILCGYCGNRQGNSGVIENVHVEGTVRAASAGVGGLVGVVGSGTIKMCSADVTVENESNDTGGLVGRQRDNLTDATCEIIDCWTSGSVSGQTRNAGIIGDVHADNKSFSATKIERCYSTCSVTSKTACSGGLVARAYKSNPVEITKCIAWNNKIEAQLTLSGDPSSGAVSGCNKTATLTDCVRKADIDFSADFYSASTDESPVWSPTVYDQENVSKGTPELQGKPDNITWNAYYPYHGKAAAAGETVSDVAKRLGWDETIWDLSGEYPQLIR